jgi:hypothetical protein
VEIEAHLTTSVTVAGEVRALIPREETVTEQVRKEQIRTEGDINR